MIKQELTLNCGCVDVKGNEAEAFDTLHNLFERTAAHLFYSHGIEISAINFEQIDLDEPTANETSFRPTGLAFDVVANSNESAKQKVYDLISSESFKSLAANSGVYIDWIDFE